MSDGLHLAGLVDFIGALVPLPAGTQQVFLAMAFFIEGFLMLMHQKHEALDAVIHWLLGCTMWAAAAFVALELHWANTSFLASVGRAFSCIMQGIWLMQVSTAPTIFLPQPPRFFPGRLLHLNEHRASRLQIYVGKP